MSLLSVRDLRCGYGTIEVLHGISLALEAGEIVALLGSNGAGKTTTLRAITGLVRARGGEVAFDGMHIERLAAHRIVALGLGHVPEGRRIFSPLTVEENVRLGGYLIRNDHAEMARRMEELFATFPRLHERRGQLAGTLSGGEQQMLAIARALMLRPRLLLLDEPSMGLAPKLVQAIFTIVSTVRRVGTAVLLVEQNARSALGIADRAYVLESGKIALEGRASDLAGDSRVRAAYLGGSTVAA